MIWVGPDDETLTKICFKTHWKEAIPILAWKKKFVLRRGGVEPATYGYLKPSTVHRSTNWAIDGAIKVIFHVVNKKKYDEMIFRKLMRIEYFGGNPSYVHKFILTQKKKCSKHRVSGLIWIGKQIEWLRKMYLSTIFCLAAVAWLSWLKRLPSKQEITSSNLVVTF